MKNLISGKTKITQKHYQGFLNTPTLWEGKTIEKLEQFKILSPTNKINIKIDNTLRLGKYVERLVSFQLSQQQNITVLAENIQIKKDKLTLGELDCLLLKDGKPIHLEVIYKFYLYDDTVGNSEIDHFIGPNRRDALVKKLDKLKAKQLPLLYSDACKPYLENLNLNAEYIIQKVYFKAQLFLPFNNQDVQLKMVNPNCVSGFYTKQNELDNFNNCKFYIPSKKDWLIKPHTNVDWLNYSQFVVITSEYLSQKYASLFWLKLKNGEIKKVFLVWW